ncbi:CLUMA_CG014481, isoform A [Clunio marinus]|uniref:CLUMA_CG014481, isoform A n=1 Tax=Clunio marinus TaxID=568069 RepID=A0A1J1IMV3_9DIPT|nr:CLUMA_CG014481, isoform A [Clunio marinus]
MKMKVPIFVLFATILSNQFVNSADSVTDLMKLIRNHRASPIQECFRDICHWRCGDWRSKFRILNCDDPFRPVIDFPPDYDFSKDKKDFKGLLLRFHGIAAFGYPPVYRESDVPQ